MDAAGIIALLDKHAPLPTARIGLSPAQVRALTAQPRRPRDRRRRTPRGRIYGMIKVAAASIPPEGIIVSDINQADKLRTVARRMGIKLCVRRVGQGPARFVFPALTGAELSFLGSQL